jgi:hypothetical protein
MEWVIVALLIGICILLGAILSNLQIIVNKQSSHDEHLATIFGEITAVHSEVKKKGTVTDPFQAANKSHTVGATSKHIVVRKTPDQIRAENAEAIKNGGRSYGSPT